MSKHTPGPWEVKHLKKKDIIFIVSENRYVAQTPDFGTEKEPHELADAERIVSCVNSLEGIADPAKFREAFEAMESALNIAILEIQEGGVKNISMKTFDYFSIALQKAQEAKL